MNQDIDILGAVVYNNVVVWWENNGNENFTLHTIGQDFEGAVSVHAVDIDRDNDIDVRRVPISLRISPGGKVIFLALKKNILIILNDAIMDQP